MRRKVLILFVFLFSFTFFYCRGFDFLGFKIWGDLKFKTQYKKVDNKDGKNKSSTRFRIYFLKKVVKHLSVGFGFSSGRGYVGSYDVDLDDFFERDSLRLNNLYLKVDFSRVNFWFGKEKGVSSVMWKFSDLLWDHDLTPSGFGGQVKLLNSHFFSSDGLIFLNRKNSSRDKPFILYFQNGLLYKGIKFDITFYDGENLKGNRLLYSRKTNTFENGLLKYDYNVVTFDFNIKRKFLKKIPYLDFLGNYAKNLDPSEDNKAFLVGFWFGVGKPLKRNQWKFLYMFRYLEKDAWLDTLADSGSFKGSTGIKGSELIFKYALLNNFDTVIDYYKLSKMSGEDLNLIQFKLLYYF